MHVDMCLVDKNMQNTHYNNNIMDTHNEKLLVSFIIEIISNFTNCHFEKFI